MMQLKTPHAAMKIKDPVCCSKDLVHPNKDFFKELVLKQILVFPLAHLWGKAAELCWPAPAFSVEPKCAHTPCTACALGEEGRDHPPRAQHGPSWSRCAVYVHDGWTNSVHFKYTIQSNLYHLSMNCFRGLID